MPALTQYGGAGHCEACFQINSTSYTELLRPNNFNMTKES
ncbi:hypothetical protein C942_01612 [Photobacterium marinum]|uniref:Uncharacterized protein n=1 Tax=Photobacterium marinum TaxID=1056511 RepID=L8JJS9_9GAMM|nr:hypothetical protein C942_01612 [Photobacterium marinum]